MLCVTWLIEHRVGFSQGKRCTPCFLVGILMSHKDCTVFSKCFYTKIERKYWHPWLASSIESQRIYIFERKRNDNPRVLFVCLFLPEQINLQIFSSILILRPVTSSYSTSLGGLLSWVHRFHR